MFVEENTQALSGSVLVFLDHIHSPTATKHPAMSAEINACWGRQHCNVQNWPAVRIAC